MCLTGASSIEEADRFIKESNFIEKYNTRFAIVPVQLACAHRLADYDDLDTLPFVCVKDEYSPTVTRQCTTNEAFNLLYSNKQSSGLGIKLQ